jgi:glucose/arabinose dehydrogenase
MKFTWLCILVCVLPAIPGVAASELPLHLIKLPPGFRIEVYAADVPGARSMALSPAGTLFVGTRNRGIVYALRDTNGDQHADQADVVDRGLNMPNGVAFRGGSLYVAEVDRILRYDHIETRLAEPPAPVVINDSYPADTHHGWKFIRFGPDGKLYVPIGAPCNICEAPGYGVITRLDTDGGRRETYAEGVRNTVGFDWHPDTHELWFTDNGRDRLGDDQPPDELNHAPQQGMHFGFPYCHGGDVRDPDYGEQAPCSQFTPPARKLGPHVASLGMRFYTGAMFPTEYRKQIFIAEHGSWNRSTPIGYRVSLVKLQGGQIPSYETFAEGWLQGTVAWGRPVDVLVMPDGALLVSDDKAGAIYRISYGGK